MYNLAKGLTALAALAFVLAVVGNFTGGMLSTTPEGFSRASSNLAMGVVTERLSLSTILEHPEAQITQV